MKLPSFDRDVVVDSAIEAVILYALWLLLVSKRQPHELLLGVPCAIVAAVADAVVKAQDLAPLRPRWRELRLLALEPWYILVGTANVLEALARRLAGRRLGSRVEALRFHAVGADGESAARRALATILLSIPPNSIVVAVDRSRGRLLQHRILPGRLEGLARALGLREP